MTMITSISSGVFYGASSPKRIKACECDLLLQGLSILDQTQNFRYTSITDPWARMISYHFLNGTSRDNFFQNSSAHGAGQLWSRIPEIPSWQQHLTPFPLVVANSRPVGSNLTTVLTPEPIVYEVLYLMKANSQVLNDLSPSIDHTCGIRFLGSKSIGDGEHNLRRDEFQ